MDCTSESLPDPADELLPPGQLLQTLTPGLIDVLQQLFGMDKLLVDPVQFFVAKVVQDSLKKSSKQVVKESLQEKVVCALELAPGPPKTTMLTVPTVLPTKLPGLAGA